MERKPKYEQQDLLPRNLGIIPDTGVPHTFPSGKRGGSDIDRPPPRPFRDPFAALSRGRGEESLSVETKVNQKSHNLLDQEGARAMKEMGVGDGGRWQRGGPETYSATATLVESLARAGGAN